MNNWEQSIIKNYNLLSGEDGIHFDVEIYISDKTEQLSVYISHDGSSGAEYPIHTISDICAAFEKYINNYL